jgi:hypothetical protein
MMWTAAAHADRISEMEKVELCVYTAKLEVAGMYYFMKGTARADVELHWHGDETENEIQFVNAAIDHAYQWLTLAQERNARESYSAQAFGDMIYSACINGQEL